MRHSSLKLEEGPLTKFFIETRPTLRRVICNIIRSFLRRFDTTDFPSVEDAALEDLCIKEAQRRGYALDVLKPSLTVTVGLNIAATAYHHLANVKVKVYIVFFTAFATYFDDAYPDDPDALVGVPNFTKVSIVTLQMSAINIFHAALYFLGETAEQDARRLCERPSRDISAL